MKLNDRQLRNLRYDASNPSRQTFADGKGLFVELTKSGGKLWRMAYRFQGKSKLLSIGKYPDVTLAEARKATDDARALLAQGIDPCAAKQEAKAAQRAALANTFEHIARQWHENGCLNLKWQPNHAARIWRYFENDVLPYIGAQPIAELRIKDIRAVLDRIRGRGVLETAEKIRNWLSMVFRFAIQQEISENNPADALTGYLPKHKGEHMPALPREELIEFYRRLLLENTRQQNRILVMLIMLCFARNTEIRGGEWREIDFKKRVWTIPAERMKMKRLHLIPLSDWAVELLQELHELTGRTPFLFPSRTNAGGYVSENTAGAIMKRMGYDGIATPHGFRSLASSTLNEQGYNGDAIERQLAHEESNRIRAAYNRTDYMEERAAFMQWYSDFLRDKYRQAEQLAKGAAD